MLASAVTDDASLRDSISYRARYSGVPTSSGFAHRHSFNESNIQSSFFALEMRRQCSSLEHCRGFVNGTLCMCAKSRVERTSSENALLRRVISFDHAFPRTPSRGDWHDVEFNLIGPQSPKSKTIIATFLTSS